jgi:predicted house-cleaning noncanonical NTP pyrophosphatase (MazG superfamily)
MPEFEFNKLVRDKLRDEYALAGQEATYIELTPSEHKQKLIRKIIEEVLEIDINEPVEKITSEIGDIRQCLDDLTAICGATEEQVMDAKQAKYDKKGGFENGTFVKTLKLADGDEWVDYYRKRPDIFPEV